MTAIRRYDLLRTRLNSFTRMLPGVESGQVGAVHRTRVASRRLREVLPVLQLDTDQIRKLGRRLRRLTRRLGAVRELDVLVSLLDELPDARPSEKALTRIVRAVRSDREAALRRLKHKDVAADLRRLEKKLESLASQLEDVDRGRSHGQAWRWAIDARVARRGALLRHAIREAGSMYVPDRIHGVRLALKKLRYGLELSVESAGLKGSAELRMLKRCQDLLGQLRDQQVLMERLRLEQASMTPPDLEAWRELDAVVTSLENNCRRLHARYVRQRDGLTTMCDRLNVRAASAAARRAG